MTPAKIDNDAVRTQHIFEDAVRAEHLDIEVVSVGQNWPAGFSAKRQATCPNGGKVLSGGLATDDLSMELLQSYPLSTTTWVVWAFNGGGTAAGDSIGLVCLRM